MSEVSEILEEIDKQISSFKRVGEMHGYDGALNEVVLLDKIKALLSSHAVIDKNCAKYSSSVVETYTKNQMFTAAQAGKVSWYKQQFMDELSRLSAHKEG
jgi:hypothetical protein